MPPATVVARLIAMMVGRKLVRNPNTYASLLGLLWSLISFRYPEAFAVAAVARAYTHTMDTDHETKTHTGGASSCH